MVLDSAERFVIPFPDHPAFNDWNSVLVFLTLGLTTDQGVDTGIGSNGPYGDQFYYLDTNNGATLRNATFFGFINKPNEFPGENNCDYIGMRPDFTNHSSIGLRISDNYESRFYYDNQLHIGRINGDGTFVDGVDINSEFSTPDGDHIAESAGNFCYYSYFFLKINNKGLANQSMDFIGINSYAQSTAKINSLFIEYETNSFKDEHEGLDIPYPNTKDLPNAFILYLPYSSHRFKIYNFGVKRLA